MAEEREYGPFEVDQHITAHSKYYAGRIGSLFYAALRDDKKILGITCRKCNRVYWPPRQTCGPCFYNMAESDMMEIGPQGILEAFTLVTYSEPVHPRRAPFIYGIIRLDGADTGMAHFVDEVDFERLEIGMRMQPVFEEERKGTILDIRHFKPV
jgi:uncharacterized OB-fold protein